MRRFLPPLLLLLAACNPASKEGEPRRVRIAVGSAGGIPLLPPTLCDRLGHFRQEKLDVEIVDMPVARQALTAALLGDVDVVVTFAEGVFTMAGAGKDLRAFGQLFNSPGLVIAVSPRKAGRITRVEDLKGATVGTVGVGGGSHRYVNRLLANHGLQPSDISTITIGPGPARLAALEQGSVDAAVLGEPFIGQLLKRRPETRLLADLRTEEGLKQLFGTADYPTTALIATAAWLQGNPDTARSVARALKNTLEWIHSHSAEEIAAQMPPSFQGDDPELYVETIRKLQPQFSRDGTISRQGMLTVLRLVSESDANIRSADVKVDEVFTNEFLP